MSEQNSEQAQENKEAFLNTLKYGVQKLQAQENLRINLTNRGLSIEDISVIVGKPPIELQFDQFNLNILVNALENLKAADEESEEAGSEDKTEG